MAKVTDNLTTVQCKKKKREKESAQEEQHAVENIFRLPMQKAVLKP